MEERAAFILVLEGFLRDLQINREKHEFPEKSIMDMAETKEKRQHLLDTFFRVVCLQVLFTLSLELRKCPVNFNLKHNKNYSVEYH